jgi:hypothetical protein
MPVHVLITSFAWAKSTKHVIEADENRAQIGRDLCNGSVWCKSGHFAGHCGMNGLLARARLQ